MDGWAAHIDSGLAALARFAGSEAMPWLLLLALLLARPPGLREILRARQAVRARHQRHLSNLTRFCGELAKRQAREGQPRIGQRR